MLADPPDVEIVRIIDGSESDVVMHECMTAQGFSVTRLQGGIVFNDVPEDQVKALNRAAYTCEAQYPVDPRQLVLLDEAGAGALYVHLTTVAAPCLEGLGHTIDEPPTQEAWVQSYQQLAPGMWDPFAGVAESVTPEEFDEVLRECPERPDGLYPPVPQP